MIDLSNENVFFVSDTHFNHTKLCTGYEDHFERTRKYETIEEMNEDIIDQWNKSITKDDVVIFLGDFSWGKPFKKIPYYAKYFYPKLNSKGIIWVEGNHDAILRKTFNIVVINGRFRNVAVIVLETFLGINMKNKEIYSSTKMEKHLMKH